MKKHIKTQSSVEVNLLLTVPLVEDWDVKSWAASHEGDNIIKLKPGQHLSDAVQDEGWLS